MTHIDLLQRLEFTGELANIAQIVGKPQAYQICQEFGDLRKIYFPKRKKGKYFNRLASIVGQEKANALCDAYLGECVDISQHKRAFAYIKHSDAVVLTMLGYSPAFVSQTLGMHIRTVKEILRKSNLGQMNLFQKVLPRDFACGSSESRDVAMRGDFSTASLRGGGDGCEYKVSG